jgi:hypothetical protein
MWRRLEDLDCLAEGPHVGPFPVHAEAPVVPKGKAPQPASPREDLPGDHEVERQPQLVRRGAHREAVGMGGVVGRNQHAPARRGSLAHVLHAVGFYVHEALAAELRMPAAGSPETQPERTQLGRPPLRRPFERLTVHGRRSSSQAVEEDLE